MSSTGAGVGPGLLDERRHDRLNRGVREVPLAGELDHRQAGRPCDRAHALETRTPGLDPAGGRKLRWSWRPSCVSGEQVVEEQAAVVDDARDHVDVAAGGGVQAQLAGPGLERVEDHHRPVDAIAEALEAVDQVEREAVGGPGRDTDQAREPGVLERLHPVPDRLAGVAGAVGVVQQQQVELVDAAALEAALGRHPQVARVLLGPAQARVGEARKALGAVALALVEVVTDGADDADLARA